MNKQRKDIIEYNENLKNEIDIMCEKKLCELNECKFEEDKINHFRNKMFSKIKEIQDYNLTNLNGKCKFGHFLPLEESHLSSNEIASFGTLIITNEIIAVKSFKILIELVNKGMEFYQLEDNCKQLGSFAEFLKIWIFWHLIKEKLCALNNDIIDLTILEKNVIKKLELNNYTFEYQPKEMNSIVEYIKIDELEQLDFECNIKNVEKIQRDIFNNFTNLKILIFKRLYVEKLIERNFEPLVNLKKLNVDHCAIQTVEKNAFYGLKNLRELIFTENLIDEIEADTFNGVDDLEYLCLNGNKLNIIHENTFIKVKNLFHLDLTVNHLERLTSNCFYGLEKLKVLDLAYNHQNFKIDKNVFSVFKSLEVLHLQANELNDLDADIFTGLDNLRCLNFKDNFCSDFTFLNCLRQLEFLDLSTIGPIYNFEQIKLENLRFLKLSLNTVPKFGENFKKLQALDIDHVIGFEQDTFENLISLDYLIISVNEIRVIDEITNDSFKYVRNLCHFKIELSFVYNNSQDDLTDNLRRKLPIFLSLFDKKSKIEHDILNFGRCYFIIIKNYESDVKYFDKILKISKITRDFAIY